jgi:MtrB/PioB family decaheme-associated outer membrane protein
MTTKTSLLIIYSAIAGAVTSGAYAQETVAPDAFPEEFEATVETAKPVVPDAFVSEPVYSDIELGIGYVADDAYFFGRYNGLQTEGPYVVGDIDARQFSEDGRYWSIRGTNLGLESRYLRLEGGKQGRHSFFLEWDELPNYMNNTVVTPFLGVGSDNLTLPSGFILSEPLTPQFPFELQTKRERIKVGAGFVAKQRWLFDIDFSHENKQGVKSIGGATATGTTTNINQTVTTSLLPEPVDYDTNQVNAILTYAGDQGQVDLKYHASFFDNNYDSLTWQNPFPTTTTAGSLALAPDNEFHQLSLTGAYTLPYRSRITAVASMGRMTQNQQFQDYTINSGIATTDLPSTSLDGEVWVLNGQLKLASRPVNKLRLNADLVYDERDNQTPVNTYGYIMLDGLPRSGTQNNPYSYKKGTFKLDANYRFNAISSLRGGYKYNTIERSQFQAGREETDENTLFAKFKIKPHATVDFELYGEAGSRDGSDFDSQGYQDPLMRKYNLADRDRTKAGALINYMATDKLFFGLRGDYSEDDYTDTQIGLTEATQPSATFDVSYTPIANLTTYGYYTWQNITSSQNGNDVTQLGSGPGGGAIPTTGPWQADFDDEFNTVGIGGKWSGLGKWDLGADVVYTKAVGQILMNSENPTVFEDQFPDTLSEMISLKLYTDYHYSKRLSYKLGYWYEEYVADNWAVDDLEPYQPGAVTNTLLLGEQTMDYEVRVFTVSATYRFQ